MENVIYFLLVSFIAFAFTALSIPQIVRIAFAKKLFDKPGERKVNERIVPTIGGVALFIGITLGVTLGSDGFPFFNLKFIFASLLVIFMAGMKDDLLGISPVSKLLAMTLSLAIIFFFAKLQITQFYGLFGLHEIGIIPSFLLTFFLGIVVINSLNLIDGIDGLASAITIQISGILGVWFALIGLPEYALLSFAVVGSCAAFFVFNVFGHKNKIFMGDTGSLILGTVLFVLVVKFNEFNAAYTGRFMIQSVPAVLFGFMAYPLFDVLRVFLLRVFILKRSPFSADKNHIHHRLLAIGLTHLQATVVIVFTNSIFIAVGLFLQYYLSVLSIVLILLGMCLFLSFALEIFVYKKKCIVSSDKFQTLMIPKALMKAGA